MKKIILSVLLGFVSSLLYAEEVKFRPPAVPLVVHDPYFSIWSPADRLTDAETMHWTGKKHPLHAMIRIDGKTYRLMGAEPKDVPAMKQTNLTVTPTRTVYEFECDEAIVKLEFLTPLLPDSLDLMSRPATYLLCTALSHGNALRNMAFYFDAGAEIAVNRPDQIVSWSKLDVPDTTTIKLGTVEQPILASRGDDIRIDWGHMLVSVKHVVNFPAELGPKFTFSVQPGPTLRKSFVEKGKISEESVAGPLPAADLSIGHVWTVEKPFSGGAIGVILAYDDIDSVRYFGDDLKAWWKRDGQTVESMLAEAWNDAVEAIFRKPNNLNDRCMAFDQQFITDLKKVGGEGYAKLCALAYRQSLGAQKIVADVNGMPLMFSKENDSNGCMGTIDVMYPAMPMLLYYSPALVKATLQPIFAYAETERWKFPFAPHDLGTYPHATGQAYGGGERSEENQMPVEESANMVILTAALAVAEQKPDFAKLHWETLTKWADYLLDKGFDPENQLCTDDFAGHLAHNVNLSAKAIVAIGAYAGLAEKLGKADIAKKYRAAAEEFVQRWIKEADDGDHFRLAFDKPGTWSIKYNLMWDEVLDLKLFPRSVMDKELAFYKTKMQKYGLPLDNRSLYTKNDWIIWTATMTKTQEEFDTLVQPVIAFVNNTEPRVPMTDWYYTDSARRSGFKARSVVGGFFAPMLKDRKKWLAQAAKGADIDSTKPWASILLPPRPVKSIAETAIDGNIEWRYTTSKPAEGWEKANFDDSAWQTGRAGFGTRDTPGTIVGTRWNSSDIWIRRSFDWDGVVPDNTNLQLYLHHDEDVVVYLNGVRIFSRAGFGSNYELAPSPNLMEVLKKGKNTFAVHCLQTVGGQYIDVGISAVEEAKR